MIYMYALRYAAVICPHTKDGDIFREATAGSSLIHFAKCVQHKLPTGNPLSVQDNHFRMIKQHFGGDYPAGLKALLK